MVDYRPRLRSDRAARLPAASARSLSRCSRCSFSRWLRAAAPRIFFGLWSLSFRAARASSEDEAGTGFALSVEGEDEECESVR